MSFAPASVAGAPFEPSDNTEGSDQSCSVPGLSGLSGPIRATQCPTMACLSSRGGPLAIVGYVLYIYIYIYIYYRYYIYIYIYIYPQTEDPGSARGGPQKDALSILQQLCVYIYTYVFTNSFVYLCTYQPSDMSRGNVQVNYHITLTFGHVSGKCSGQLTYNRNLRTCLGEHLGKIRESRNLLNSSCPMTLT